MTKQVLRISIVINDKEKMDKVFDKLNNMKKQKIIDDYYIIGLIEKEKEK